MRHVHHYRESFYLGLRDSLERHDVEFDLIHGDPSPAEQAKNDAISPDWTIRQPNHVVGAGGRELIYQPVLRRTMAYDLVVVEQASRLLLNYLLLGRRALRIGPKIAMVGHGTNIAEQPSRAGEAVKRLATSQVDWFFGYTEGTRSRLIDGGFDPERITVFQNTLDMKSLSAQLESISDEDLVSYKREKGLTDHRVVLVLGSLYSGKRPDLLVPIGESLQRVRDDFSFLVVGTGPESGALQRAAATRPWLRLVGSAFGRDKALALRASDVMLIPGVSGLVLLDAFAAGLPLITASNSHHPPEIDYVRSGENGIILPDNQPEAFASAIDDLLEDADKAKVLSGAAMGTGAGLTIDEMVERFTQGVLKALKS